MDTYNPKGIIYALPASWVEVRYLMEGSVTSMSLFQAVVMYASTYVLVALSIDRCDAITNPMNFSGSWVRARGLIVSAWVISIIFSTPLLILYEVKEVQEGDYFKETYIFRSSTVLDRPGHPQALAGLDEPSFRDDIRPAGLDHSRLLRRDSDDDMDEEQSGRDESAGQLQKNEDHEERSNRWGHGLQAGQFARTDSARQNQECQNDIRHRVRVLTPILNSLSGTESFTPSPALDFRSGFIERILFRRSPAKASGISAETPFCGADAPTLSSGITDLDFNGV
ncbi:Cardioacceleratory peptide receptor [Eumeta japonica]|uniref:Cardioacceleratory peptide receptor n=1 Tax=Eumeta variegata TaxID=151549 RepID=A0A4C1T559_EUMVA|nr:Cardioacceleratory peptide receptor [Eumeta japonica]